MTEVTSSSTTPTERLTCMEVWGGNSHADAGVELPGIDAWVFSEPYNGGESGGDVHYVSSCASGRITRFLLADVSGHGPPVAGIAEDLRAIMRRHINRIDQTQMVEAVNEEFRPLHKRGTHATAIAGTYFLPTATLTVCNAGHPAPLLYRAAEGRWIQLERHLLDDSGGPKSLTEVHLNIPLGILPNSSWTPIELDFQADDLLLMYTDSSIEAIGRTGEEIGTDGLQELVEETYDGDPGQLVRRLVARLRVETDGRPFEDDLSLVLLRGNGSPTRLRDDLLAPFRYLADSVAQALPARG